MKKFRSMSLVLCLVMLVSTINVFAIKEEQTTDMLFEEDFEQVQVDSAPTSILKNGSSIGTATTALVKKDENDSKNTTNHLLLDSTSDFRMRTPFKSAMESGKFCYEFDALMETNGFLQLAVVYEGGYEVTGKWVFAAYSDRTMGAYPNTGAAPTSAHPTVTDTTAPGYGVSYTSKTDDSELTYQNDEWHNYKFVIDMDNSSVTLYLDGKESGTISNFAYISTANAISEIGFRKYAGSGKIKIDNIKAYKMPYYVTYSVEDDCSTNHSAYSSWSLTTDTSLKSSIIKKSQSRSLNASDANKTETNVITDGDNDVIQVPYGAIGAYTIPSCNTKLFIEFDYQVGAGGFAVVLRDASNNAFGWRSPYASRRSNACYAVNDYGTEPKTANTTGYKIAGTDTNLTSTSYQWDHAKIELDLTTGESILTVNNVSSDPITINYFKGMTVNGVGFRHYKTNTGVNDVNDLFFDNVKISYLSDGNSISNIQSASNRFKMIFKDNVDMATITKDNIKVLNSNGEQIAIDKDLKSNGRGVLVETAVDLTPGEVYTVILPETAKYTDGNLIVETKETFECVEASFTATIAFDGAVSYTKGSEIKAVCNVDAKELAARKIQLFIASYDGNKLVDVNANNAVQIYDMNYGAETHDISFTLSDDVTRLKAFVWDDKMAPLSECADSSNE